MRVLKEDIDNAQRVLRKIAVNGCLQPHEVTALLYVGQVLNELSIERDGGEHPSTTEERSDSVVEG